MCWDFKKYIIINLSPKEELEDQIGIPPTPFFVNYTKIPLDVNCTEYFLPIVSFGIRF